MDLATGEEKWTYEAGGGFIGSPAVADQKLFIASEEVQLPVRLKIRSLKDLEDKIIGVIVAALAVAFLGQAAGSSKPEALLNYGGGIALVIAALAFFMSKGVKDEDESS